MSKHPINLRKTGRITNHSSKFDWLKKQRQLAVVVAVNHDDLFGYKCRVVADQLNRKLVNCGYAVCVALSALVPGPLHGYGLLGAVEDLSEGRLRLRAGTLYAALERMVGDSWLQVDREEVVDGRLRRYYRITDLGVEVIDAEIANLEANAATARRQLALRLKPGLA